MHDEPVADQHDSWQIILLRWATPSGGTYVDGIRLAVINTVLIILTLLAAGVVSILFRIADWLLPLPSIPIAYGVLALGIAVGGFVWLRYAEDHVRAAVSRGRQVQPDLFGIIGGLPFIGIALLTLGAGFLGLLFAMISLDLGDAGNAVGKMFIGLLILFLVLGIILAARHAAKDRNGTLSV